MNQLLDFLISRFYRLKTRVTGKHFRPIYLCEECGKPATQFRVEGHANYGFCDEH